MSEEIKKSKTKIFLTNAWEEFKYNLGYCLGQLTPARRLLLVLFFGGTFAAAYVCILVSTIYNIGKREAEKEFLEIRHIESLNNYEFSITNYELQTTNKENEYEH